MGGSASRDLNPVGAEAPSTNEVPEPVATPHFTNQPADVRLNGRGNKRPRLVMCAAFARFHAPNAK